VTATERTWPSLLTALLTRADLAAEDTEWAMNEIMAGEASSAQIAGFAIALRTKEITAAEMTGLATAMLAHAEPITVTGPAVDLVGTGGDGAHTVNISTMGAIVAAAAGARVVKHGNRSASSKAGAADVLEELGVAIDLLGEDVARCVDELGIGFCFASRFHPALRHAAAPRRELGVPTAFNYLGPLTNPARPPARAIGCADFAMADVMAQVTAGDGATGMVFRGDDGLDELTTTTTSHAWVIVGGEVTVDVIDPGALGLPVGSVEALRGGDAADNARVARAVLGGERGPVRDAVILNAAAAIASFSGLSGGLAQGLTPALRRGLDAAADAIDSGAATRLLNRWADLSTGLAAR
jgi:anthranilate phosphoribosyltransferase